MSDRIATPRLSEMVADRIKKLIIEDRLRPGDRLPTELNLASRFGVSRISVREATRALGFFGILDAKPGRGLTVGHVDMSRISTYLGFQLATSDYPRMELIESRIVIETGVLSYVMQRMKDDPEVYENLNRINSQLGSTDLIEERIAIDSQFHQGLFAASRLGPLKSFNDLLQIFFNQFRGTFNKGDWAAGVKSHQKIIDSLRGGKLEAACKEVRKHIEYHRKGL